MEDPPFDAPPHAPTHAGPADQPRDLSMIRIPMLISGIFNCLTALWWLSTCFLFFLAAPLIVLAIYEFTTFNRLGRSRAEQDALRGRSRTLAILATCSIVLINLPSFVCGIIQLVSQNTFDD